MSGFPPPPPPPPPGGPPPAGPPQWGRSGGGPVAGWYAPPGQPVAGWGGPQFPVLPGSGRFRAQAVGELLDSAFTLYRRNLRLIIAITVVAQLPLALFSYIVYQLTGVNDTLTRLQQLSARGSAVTAPQVRALVPSLEGYVAAILGIALLQFLVVQPIATAAMTRAVGSIYLDQPISVAGAYAAVRRRIWSVAGVSLIHLAAGLGLLVVVFALLIGAVLLLGPAGAALLAVLLPAVVVVEIVVYIRWLFAASTVMLEGTRAVPALRRSWHLVRGSSWRIFGIVLLVGLITGILSAVVSAVLNIVTGVGDPAARLILSQVATLVIAVLIQPISFIVVVLLYYDMRIRREGFDIEMLAAAL